MDPLQPPPPVNNFLYLTVPGILTTGKILNPAVRAGERIFRVLEGELPDDEHRCCFQLASIQLRLFGYKTLSVLTFA